MESSAVSARLIGAIFVEKGLVTEEQLEQALEQQRATGDRLGEILVDRFGIERLDLASALAEQWAEYERQGNAEEREARGEGHVPAAVTDDIPSTPTPSVKRPIGEIFVERGLVTDEQLEDALEQQRATGARLGEVLVASGRLSRLELASALADQWATFQKLRPPAETPTPDSNGDAVTAPAAGVVMPTPEVVAAAAPAVSPELVGRVDALASRIDQIAAEKSDWKPQVEKTAELLRARMEQLEEQLSSRRSEGAAPDELRGELAALAERIDRIPAPSEEWRLELAQVAENLRTRIERVEQSTLSDQVTELRASLDGLAGRLDSLPTPTEEWRDAVAGLASRFDALPAPSEEWREHIAELQTVFTDTATDDGGSKELRQSLEALVQRVDSLPAPSQEWRAEIEAIRRDLGTSATAREAVLDDLRSSLDAVAARIDSLPAPSEDWRGAVSELAARIESLPAPSEDWRAAVSELASRIELLPAPAEEWRGPVADLTARVDSLPLDGWRTELAEVAENLRTRIERVEHGVAGASPPEELAELRSSLESLATTVESLPVPAEEWRDAVAELAGRIEALPAPSEEWREQVVDLGTRVDSLPLDAWRPELAEVAENLRLRVERVEQAQQSTAATDELAQLRSSLDGVVARLASLPIPSEEWRDQISQAADGLSKRVERIEEGMIGQARAAAVTEIAERLGELAQRVAAADVFEARLQALGAQIDALPGSAEAWREPLAQLATRIEELPVASEEWREQIAGLAGRLDGLRTDEWRPELAQVAENLRVRIEKIEREAATAPVEQLDGLRSEVAELTARIDAVPTTSDDVPAQLAELAETLNGRVENVERRLANGVSRDVLAGVSTRLDELAARVADTSELESRLHESLTGLVDERTSELKIDGEDVRGRLDEALHRIAGLAGITERVGQVEERLEAGAAELGPTLNELRENGARHGSRIEELAQTIREIGGRRDAAEVEQQLAGRIDGTEAALADLHAGLDALTPAIEERIAAVEMRSNAVSQQEAADVESLRRELDDLRAVVDASSDAGAARVDDLAESLRAELVGVTEQFAPSGIVTDLRSLVDQQGERLEGLGGELVKFEHYADEKAAGQTAALAALQARLETVETGLTEAGRMSQAVETLEARLIETSASEAVERNAEVETLRSALSERIAALETGQVKRKDLRELRDGLERVEQRVTDRNDSDDAAKRAVEEAVREGLAGLGERLTATETTYLDAGRALRRSIEGLGQVISGADAHLAGVTAAVPAVETVQATSYVAFAPTPEGYRLVACDGGTPALGGTIELPELEGVLTVTRVGASPLPFDTRPCVYLEHA